MQGALTLTTQTWRSRATVTKGPPHWGLLRMDVSVQPLYNTVAHAVAPHGLLGQTYDGDGLPVHGQRDRYDRLDDGLPTRARTHAGGTVTTRARGEGAIEGSSEMYRVSRPFDTAFVFSRFGLQSATSRNVTALQVQRGETPRLHVEVPP
mmetsp:Transcript_66131/g.174579  ORF Transcript_66131/g.174579 Transcript_66131/m.174579 type:complete len:150 (-) Transcript_66131:188-637(-)